MPVTKKKATSPGQLKGPRYKYIVPNQFATVPYFHQWAEVPPKKNKSGPCHGGNEPSNAGRDDYTLLQGKTYSTRYTDKDKKKKV